MRKLALIALFPAALAYGQDPQPPAQAPAAAESPGVVDALMTDLTLTQPQAEAWWQF